MIDLNYVIKIADKIRSLKTKKEKQKLIDTLSDDIITILSNTINKNGIGPEIFEEINTYNSDTNINIRNIIEKFDIASKLSSTNEKREILSTLYLTPKEKEFLSHCFYPIKYGSLNLGIKINPRQTITGIIKPMLAKSGDFDPSKMIIERKYDGHRCIAKNINNKIELFTRQGKPFKGAKIIEDKLYLDHNTIVDGEIISLDDNFEKLDINSTNLIYKIFDILYYKGENVQNKPFKIRRSILELIIKENEHIQLSEILNLKSIEHIDIWIKGTNAEGIIVKDPNSPYFQNKRIWLKYKHFNDLNAKIIGITEGTGKRKNIMGALEVIPEGLNQVTKVGTGFSDQQLLDISERIKNGEKLNCIVKYQNITKDGKLRFPVFMRLNE